MFLNHSSHIYKFISAFLGKKMSVSVLNATNIYANFSFFYFAYFSPISGRELC